MKQQSAEEWLLGLTDDAARADVMKARLAADAATEQHRTSEQEQTKRERSRSANYQASKWFALVALILISITAAGTTCQTSADRARVEETRIRAEHPGSWPAPSSSAAEPRPCTCVR